MLKKNKTKKLGMFGLENNCNTFERNTIYPRKFEEKKLAKLRASEEKTGKGYNA